MPVLLAALALGTALLRRWARRHGTAWTVEALVIVGAALLAAIGLLATLMAVLGWFSSQAIVLVLAAAAVGVLAVAPVVPVVVVVTVAAIAALRLHQPLLLKPEPELSFHLIPNYLSSLWQCSLKE